MGIERKHVFFKVICESHFQEKTTLNTLIKIHLSHSEFIPLSNSLSESLYHSIRVDRVVCILIPCQHIPICPGNRTVFLPFHPLMHLGKNSTHNWNLYWLHFWKKLVTDLVKEQGYIANVSD